MQDVLPGAPYPPHRFHFISGLPRSGSTLLAALLRQNPRFHADMSSPVAGLVHSLLGEMSKRNEFSGVVDDHQRKRVLTRVVSAFYEDQTAEVIFDTNRSWCTDIALLQELLPGTKVIACVRDIVWILDSVERLVQRNVFQPSGLFGYRTDGSIYTRAETLTAHDGLVGSAYNALKQAYYGAHSVSLMLLQYETLARDPGRAMEAVYRFIGETPFMHDFDHAQYDACDFDARMGTPGLHDVRAKVEFSERSTIVPPDLIKRYADSAFWKIPSLNTRNVLVV
ncbi:sulfotransferase [Silvimonas terrae]|uniref:Sulfotransferase n=1 Tax=Silvimonas terrae TaxID=300266 RepID=A0A840RBA2_9NEIS|nr:sulfotransferase [Silvimonas terrae]MBB5189581.1 sulfotransferase [Silvimonas terrae]